MCSRLSAAAAAAAFAGAVCVLEARDEPIVTGRCVERQLLQIVDPRHRLFAEDVHPADVGEVQCPVALASSRASSSGRIFSSTKWYSANGFRAVQLDATSMLTSLKTNMIRAVPAPPLFAQLLTWYRSAPYMMDVGFAPLMGSTVMSLDTWTTIFADDQRVVLEEAARAGQRLRTDIPRLETEAVETMKLSGLKITAVDAPEWRRLAEQFGEAMRKDGVVPADIYDMARRERDAVRARRERR